jgi:hypothetical protein
MRTGTVCLVLPPPAVPTGINGDVCRHVWKGNTAFAVVCAYAERLESFE